MYNLILASGSPRRRELLEAAGYAFTIAPSAFDESTVDWHSMPPHELAKFLSMKKAEEAAVRHPDSVVLGADTFIVFEGEIMGKPHTPEEARRMLRALSGQTHSVITGYTVIKGEVKKSEAIESRVTFKNLSDKEIQDYVATGEPLDKAGAYAIQGLGSALVERLDGSMDNVVGLPVNEVSATLLTLGLQKKQ